MFETSSPKYLNMSNFSQISEGLGSYEHRKFRLTSQLKVQIIRHNYAKVVTSQIFCYRYVEYIKVDTCAKFHGHRSNNSKVMMGPTCLHPHDRRFKKSPCQIGSRDRLVASLGNFSPGHFLQQPNSGIVQGAETLLLMRLLALICGMHIQITFYHQEPKLL